MIGAIEKCLDPRTSVETLNALKLKQSQGENYFTQKTFWRNDFTVNQIEILAPLGSSRKGFVSSLIAI